MTTAAPPDDGTLLELYHAMVRIRAVEEEIVRVYPEQEMRCPTHLSIGQEAVAAGMCASLRLSDHVYSNHRCHAHYLAKGGDAGALFAELYGKATGCDGGIGGSMHLTWAQTGMMGGSAIVGSALSIAGGSALAAKLQHRDDVTVVFTGDAGPETGVFYETLNYAALMKLPLIIVIENNLYATQTPIEERQPNDRFFERGTPFGVPGVRIDGQDVTAVLAAADEAIARARRGEGPSIIHADTYRYLEHVGPNEDYDMGYRGRTEYESWLGRDPLARVADQLPARASELAAIRESVDDEVRAAMQFALDSPFPDADTAARRAFMERLR